MNKFEALLNSYGAVVLPILEYHLNSYDNSTYMRIKNMIKAYAVPGR